MECKTKYFRDPYCGSYYRAQNASKNMLCAWTAYTSRIEMEIRVLFRDMPLIQSCPLMALETY